MLLPGDQVPCVGDDLPGLVYPLLALLAAHSCGIQLTAQDTQSTVRSFWALP